MDLEIIVLSEVSQTKTNIIWEHLYVESKKKKKNPNELISKTERELYTQNTNLWLSKGKGMRGGVH